MRLQSDRIQQELKAVGIEAEMDAEEIALSRSTPGCQFPAE